MQLGDGVLVVLGHQAIQGALVALQLVDGTGLSAAFIDAQDQAAVHQFFIEVAGGSGQEQRHRALHGVGLGGEVAGHGVFASRGNSQFAFGLQQLQGITGTACAFFLDDGQHLMLKIRCPHVIQALPGHGRVFDFVRFRHERQHRVHQPGFPCRAGGLDPRSASL